MQFNQKVSARKMRRRCIYLSKAEDGRKSRVPSSRRDVLPTPDIYLSEPGHGDELQGRSSFSKRLADSEICVALRRNSRA